MVPLKDCPEGSVVRIEDLHGDPLCRGRLCALGITPGVEARVCADGDCCRIRVRGGEFCLGAEMAGRVMVSHIREA
ncbi:hypothetical protein NNJEOMEG_01612 [Fundidesulfovibrio magnetotacticus]|uniref:Ferrous iron transporter FeoA-like domain-containing protein n=1 Tax=Fundidesulfovibrio magnetotacticus TaxID=2730080 RepID=A0A6V8LTX2_9BACT|nr:FeoA family protein [Fundidesulfovibrio magnetotacticus]GFK93778.1 hypothetical protein NNJEOMEG_01612 [Fundidesulfovibrio magnetotacticus]